MRLLFSIIFISQILLACSSDITTTNGQNLVESENKDSIVQEVTTESEPFQNLARNPKNRYYKDSITVESYNFENLEPFLWQEDDYTYVINFWATWCIPCVKELPYFEQLRETYSDQKVHVVLVSIDFSKVVETNLIPFIQKENLQSEVILLDDPDANSWISKVDKNWSGAIPATVIYNKTKRKFFEKSFTYDELETELKDFIN